MRKFFMKAFCLLTAIAAAMAVFGCGKTTAGGSGGGSGGTEASGERIAVTVRFDTEAAADRGYEIGGDVVVRLSDPATAMDALKAAADELGYAVECKGDYVAGIGGLREKACGSASGWLYEVNGEYPFSSAQKCSVSDGDEVIWVYTK